MSFPRENPLRSRLAAALEDARAHAVELLSIAFPPLPFSAFEAISRATDCGLCFYFENKNKGIAEAATDFRELKVFSDARLETLSRFFPKNRRRIALYPKKPYAVPAPKIFFAGTFEKNAENFAAFPRWQITRDDEKTVICAHVFPAEKEVSAETLLADFSRLESAAKANFPTENPPEIFAESEVGGNWYSAAATRAINAIRDGRFRKIVLARARDFSLAETAKNVSGEFPAETLVAALRKRFLSNDCSVFLARVSAKNAGEKIVGASPETLVRLAEGTLETEAIAGTAKNCGNNDDAEKLSRDEKELREHRFVVEFILNKLRESGLNPRVRPEPEILTLPNVFHLRSKISAAVPAHFDVGKIAALLHPTPAMCGLPAERAAGFIRENEPFPRENFAAPVGFSDDSGEGFFAVAIRCAKISGKSARVYAGSGLVAESAPDKEFAEIDAKFSAIFSVFKNGKTA